MLRKIYFIALSSFILIGANAQTVSKKQWTMISKTSADWCSNCGSWGWNMHKQLLDKLENKQTILWALHTSGNLTNNTSAAIAANLGAVGHPRFFESLEDMNVNSSNIASKLLEAEAVVELNQLIDPFAGIGIDATIKQTGSGRELQVKAKTEFFLPVSQGDYHLGLYLVHDQLIAPQTGQGNNAVHRYLLRRSLFANHFGEPLAKGPIAAGKTFETQATITDVPEGNVKVVAVIWNRRSDGKYLFFNANLVTPQVSSSTQEENNSQEVTFMSKDQKIYIHNEQQSLSGCQFSLFDMNGMMIDNKTYEQAYDSGLGNELKTGVYMVQVFRGSRMLFSNKVIVAY